MNIRQLILRALAVVLHPVVALRLSVLFPAMIVSGCVYSVNLKEVAKAAEDRRQGPLPESEWNRPGFWVRIADSPATYIPNGYSRTAPRTGRAGTWVVDRRDGKRLFVPNTPVEGKTPGVWMGEAKKVTNWPTRATTSTYDGIMVL